MNGTQAALHAAHLARRARFAALREPPARPSWFVTRARSRAAEASERVPTLRPCKWADLAEHEQWVMEEAVWQMPTAANIQQAVARAYGLSVSDLLCVRRSLDVVGPRQLAMALAKHFLPLSLPVIGRRFHGRDHTTVLYAVRKFAPLIRHLSTRLGTSATLDDWARSARAVLEAGFELGEPKKKRGQS